MTGMPLLVERRVIESFKHLDRISPTNDRQ
jgi:hypothetical protein